MMYQAPRFARAGRLPPAVQFLPAPVVKENKRSVFGLDACAFLRFSSGCLGGR